MAYNPSVKITRLFECTSKKGTSYLRGRLGFANVVIVKTDQMSDTGQPIWNVLISEPEQKPEESHQQARQPRRASTPDNSEFAASNFDRGADDQIPF